jgi:hypothetical protein
MHDSRRQQRPQRVEFSICAQANTSKATSARVMKVAWL